MPAGLREAVFSSSEFRIRAAQGQAADGRFHRWVEDVAGSLFFTLFPSDCGICGALLVRISRLSVCQICLESLRSLTGSFCSVWGEALPAPVFLERGDARCGLCRRAHSLFEKAVAYGGHDGGLRDLIHLIKYQQVRLVAKVLGRMLSKAMAGADPAIPDGRIAVVPVPLHPRKKARRGFSQSELIAHAALKCMTRPERFAIGGGRLVRRRETDSQIGLTRHQRRENLRGAFAVIAPESISGCQVLLVDDVFTTATTASECARVLRKAGAAAVWVATVARTLKVVETFAVPEESPEEDREKRLTLAAHG